MKDPHSILVTGASSGIGEALAKSYAAPRVFLALAGRSRARLEAVADECRSMGAEVETGYVDVRDETAMAEWVQSIDDRHPIDLLIANAGITGGTNAEAPIETGASARTILSVNLIGAVNTVAPIVAAMRERRRGQIAMVGSLAGLYGLPYSPAYSASKAGLRAYAQALRAALAPFNVHVAIVCPGFVESPLDDSVKAAKPFRLSAAKAAATIKRGLSRSKSQIAFPFPLYAGTRILGWLPTPLANWVLNKIPVEIPEPSVGSR